MQTQFLTIFFPIVTKSRDNLMPWTNHKLRKENANEKILHVSVRICGIQARYCAVIRRQSIQVV